MTTPGRAAARHHQAGSLALLPLERVSWGAGASDTLGEQLRAAGARRVVLLTTASLLTQASVLASVERALEGLLVGRCAPVTAHVPAQGVAQALRSYRDAGADAVVTLGGGSVIDAGKALTGDLLGAGLVAPVHAALPTTLSGAELSHYYGVTTVGKDNTTKHSYARIECTPDLVVYDPLLTAATPPSLWASSGIKAIDHAIEGLLARPDTPVVDPLALLGIRHLATTLATSTDPEAVEERLACQIAAWQCFFAPAVTTLGLSHRIGHVLGGSFGVAHGLTSCVTLAPIMNAMAGRTPDRLATIDAALDPVHPVPLDGAPVGDPARAADRVAALVRSLGLPTRLRDVGLERAQLPVVVRLLRQSYPHAASQLGDRGDERVDALLRDMW